MSAFYENLRSTATRLIAQYGSDVVVTRKTGGSYSPATRKVTGNSSSNFTASGVLTDIEESMGFGQGGDSTVMQNDRALLISATNEILDDDTLTFNGRDWNIVNLKPINPGGTAVVYIAQVRA